MLQKELGEIFLTEGPKFFGTPFITVSVVRVSPDFSYAKVYLSFMNPKDPQAILARVKDQKWKVKNELAQRLRKQTRKIPELEFFYDDTMDYVERMDELFEELKKKEGREGEDPQAPNTDENKDE